MRTTYGAAGPSLPIPVRESYFSRLYNGLAGVIVGRSRRGLSGWGAGVVVPISGPLKGSGGYTYVRLSDSSYKIVAGPSGVGVVVKPGTTAWQAIHQEMTTGVAPAAASAPDPEQAGDVPSGTGNAVSSLLAMLSKTNASGATNASTIASLAAQYGPGIASAVSTAVASRGQSTAALQRKLAAARADYAKAKARGNVRKATELAYKIKGLEAQLAAASQAGQYAMTDLTTAPPAPVSAFPSWLPWATVGAVVLVGLGLFASRRGSAPVAVAA